MKRIILIIATLSIVNFTFAQEGKIDLTVDGILSPKGKLMINVFASESDYLKTPMKSLEINLSEAEDYTFEINDLPHGEYAISVVHDENANGQLDFGGMGPTEGYGFSNNPNAMYGPAPYQKAKFTFNESTAFTVKLN
ncbi:MAG: DUF2141 domain-containing protein [Bacteroidota bacterium]